jgi:hypothetical protein
VTVHIRIEPGPWIFLEAANAFSSTDLLPGVVYVEGEYSAAEMRFMHKAVMNIGDCETPRICVVRPFNDALKHVACDASGRVLYEDLSRLGEEYEGDLLEWDDASGFTLVGSEASDDETVIDWNEPIELTDGTPCELIELEGNGKYALVRVEGDPTKRSFPLTTGKHFRTDYQIRNVQSDVAKASVKPVPQPETAHADYGLF